MAERDAAPLTGMSDQNREDSGGTVNVSVYGHQTDTACKGNADSLAAMSMEEVVSRENMLKAYHRVLRNKGAPGVDGITVQALWGHVRQRWEGIREQLLSGTYVPDPVLKVEIPKPGGIALLQDRMTMSASICRIVRRVIATPVRVSLRTSCGRRVRF